MSDTVSGTQHTNIYPPQPRMTHLGAMPAKIKLRKLRSMAMYGSLLRRISFSHTSALLPKSETWVSQVSGTFSFMRLPASVGSQSPSNPYRRNSSQDLGHGKEKKSNHQREAENAKRKKDSIVKGLEPVKTAGNRATWTTYLGYFFPRMPTTNCAG